MFLVSCFLFLSPPAYAALDPQTTTLYQFQVVLHVAEHPMLTDVFKDQVGRELRDGLQAALGAVGKVDVVPLADPLKKEIDAKGLQVFDGQQPISDIKKHYVLIDFADDQYVIRTRQVDGMTGLTSPVRQARTSDRQFVARTAALLIDRDFGLVGTLDPNAKGADVKVTLKGGGLGVPLGHWVRKGDVFAIVEIHKRPDQTRGERVRWALLQVMEEPRPGESVLTCRLHQRFRQSLAGGPSLVGHRCLKLGTTEAPLRLRLLDEKQLRPLPDQAVSIQRHGFDGKAEEEGSTDVDGYLTSKKQYANVAFVQVHSGDMVRARIPIAIFEERTVLCPISVNAEAELLGQIEPHRRQWVGQLYENLLVVDALFKGLNEKVGKRDHAGALKSAQEGLTRLQGDLAARGEELGSLRTSLRDQGLQGKVDLAEGEQRLQELKARRDELQRFTANLENVLKEAKNPKRMEILGMVEQARLLEGEAEFGRAIELYKTIVDKSAEHPPVREEAQKQLARLERAWALKGDEHARARKFIYETWPKVEGPAQLKDKIDEADKMFQVCREAKDLLTPRKLLKTNLAHVTQLKKRIEMLRPRDSEEDRREAEAIVAVADQLKKLIEEVSAFLRTK